MNGFIGLNMLYIYFDLYMFLWPRGGAAAQPGLLPTDLLRPSIPESAMVGKQRIALSTHLLPNCMVNCSQEGVVGNISVMVQLPYNKLSLISSVVTMAIF